MERRNSAVRGVTAGVTHCRLYTLAATRLRRGAKFEQTSSSSAFKTRRRKHLRATPSQCLSRLSFADEQSRIEDRGAKPRLSPRLFR